MMRRHALRNDQWERIENLLPGREGTVGVTAKDNRLFVEAVLYRYRAGIPWRDCRSASAISASCTCASAAGPRPAFGLGFSSIWRKTPTMNTP